MLNYNNLLQSAATPTLDLMSKFSTTSPTCEGLET